MLCRWALAAAAVALCAAALAAGSHDGDYDYDYDYDHWADRNEGTYYSPGSDVESLSGGAVAGIIVSTIVFVAVCVCLPICCVLAWLGIGCGVLSKHTSDNSRARRNRQQQELAQQSSAQPPMQGIAPPQMQPQYSGQPQWQPNSAQWQPNGAQQPAHAPPGGGKFEAAPPPQPPPPPSYQASSAYGDAYGESSCKPAGAPPTV